MVIPTLVVLAMHISTLEYELVVVLRLEYLFISSYIILGIL